jgi:sigma-B regulation protein RsbU (phosphoserine phosphatase)
VLVSDVTTTPYYVEGMPGVHSELAVPLIVKKKVIGVIDIESPVRGHFSEEHKWLLKLVASRVAIAIENARLYTRLKRQAKSLAVLNEIARDLTSILNVDELLKRVGEQLKRLTDYQMFSILLLDPAGKKLEHRFSLRYDEKVQHKHLIPLGEGLVGYAALHNEPVVVSDVSADPRYISLNPETRSELCIPLVYQDKVIGVLDVEHTKRGYFVEQHVRTIKTLAAQVAIAIENARLYETVARQEKQMERDLVLARELQRRLLPPCCPVLPNAELAAAFHPARFVGGDLYDFVPYGNGLVGIAVGDVSGKGAPAAIYAALAAGFLRSHSTREPGPAEMMIAVNRSLTERPISAQYVSMAYAVWDDAQRQLRIANSGLPHPIYCHRGKVEVAPVSGLPMGLFADADYDELTYKPRPGDLFVFFSDGITDAVNARGEMLGRARLESIVAGHCEEPARAVVDAVVQAVATHAAGVDAFDDHTIVVLKIRPS